jgi:hypothetical protein
LEGGGSKHPIQEDGDNKHLILEDGGNKIQEDGGNLNNHKTQVVINFQEVKIS